MTAPPTIAEDEAATAELASIDTGAAAARRFRIPYAALTAVAFIAIWQLATNLLHTPSFLLPSPYAILKDLIANRDILVRQTGVTAFEVGLGYLLSIAIGMPLAILFTYSRTFERSIYPLIVGSQTIPKVAVAPLLLSWFGFGLLPKIVIVILVTFFPIIINAVVGLKSLSPNMLNLARSMGANMFQVFWRFRLPNALPSIFAGLKVATVLAVIGAVVAEFVGADGGLGYVIMMATADLNVARQFSAIVLLSVLGILFFWVIGYIERLLLPWHISVRADEHHDA
ncbi:MAG TPA: ABC transporter permease [Alphaproteobacteria bacterium]|nr:ABC transporter permease [Alphaproteobacteria bacterium]